MLQYSIMCFCEHHKFQAGDASGSGLTNLNQVLRLPLGTSPSAIESITIESITFSIIHRIKVGHRR